MSGVGVAPRRAASRQPARRRAAHRRPRSRITAYRHPAYRIAEVIRAERNERPARSRPPAAIGYPVLLVAAIVLYDGLRRGPSAPTPFLDLAGSAPSVRIPVTVLVAALVTALVGWLAALLAARPGLIGIGLLLPPVLVGYLARLPAAGPTVDSTTGLTTGSTAGSAVGPAVGSAVGPGLAPLAAPATPAAPLLVFALAVCLAGVAMLVGWQVAHRPVHFPARLTAGLLLACGVALTLAPMLGAATRINPTIAGVAPTEIARYLLLLGVVAALDTPSRRTRSRRNAALAVTIAVVPPALLLSTWDLGSSLLLAAGTLTVLRWTHGWRLTSAAAALYALVAVTFTRPERFAEQRAAAGVSVPADELRAAVRHAGAALFGVGPDASVPALAGTGRETGLVAVAERYGVTGAAVVLALLLALPWWLARCTRPDPAGTDGTDGTIGTVGTGSRPLTAALTVMLGTGVALSVLGFVTGFAFGVNVPFLTADGTSFVLATSAVGLLAGTGAAVAGASARVARPAPLVPPVPLVPLVPPPRPATPAPAGLPPRWPVRPLAGAAVVWLVFVATVLVLRTQATTYTVVGAQGESIGVATRHGGTVSTRLPDLVRRAADRSTRADQARSTVATTLDGQVTAAAQDVAELPGGSAVAIDPRSREILAVADGPHVSATGSPRPATGLADLLLLATGRPAASGPAAPASTGPALTSPALTSPMLTSPTLTSPTLAEAGCLFGFTGRRDTAWNVRTARVEAYADLCRPDADSPELRALEVGQTGAARTTTAQAAVLMATIAAPGPPRAAPDDDDGSPGCPRIVPTAGSGCARSPLDPAAVARVRATMIRASGGGEAAVLVTHGHGVQWAFGFAPATRPCIAVALVFDRPSGDDALDADPASRTDTGPTADTGPAARPDPIARQARHLATEILATRSGRC